MKIEQHDSLLIGTDWLAKRNLPVAIVLTETLEPAGTQRSIVFPPTYAFVNKALEQRGHPYPVSDLRLSDAAEKKMTPEDAQNAGLVANVCDLASVGAQGNPMESAFKEEPFNGLVPQIFIKGSKTKVNLLDAGHRVADGAARFAEDFSDEAERAIEALRQHKDASALARLAPTSLVFGFWDSRASQFKCPRIVSSTIRATNVAVAKRSAQYVPAFDIDDLAELGDLGADVRAAKDSEQAANPDNKNPLSQQGLLAAPAPDTHGGVRIFGDIIRRTEINLVALRALAVTTQSSVPEPAPEEQAAKPEKEPAAAATLRALEPESLKLRRYLLGLALVAGRAQASFNLRQGCLLVAKKGALQAAELVFPDGTRKPFDWEIGTAFDFAKLAAEDFGMYVEHPVAREFQFKPEKVVAAIKKKDAEEEARAAQSKSRKEQAEAAKKDREEKKAEEKARKEMEAAEKKAERERAKVLREAASAVKKAARDEKAAAKQGKG